MKIYPFLSFPCFKTAFLNGWWTWYPIQRIVFWIGPYISLWVARRCPTADIGTCPSFAYCLHSSWLLESESFPLLRSGPQRLAEWGTYIYQCVVLIKHGRFWHQIRRQIRYYSRVSMPLQKFHRVWRGCQISSMSLLRIYIVVFCNTALSNRETILIT